MEGNESIVKSAEGVPYTGFPCVVVQYQESCLRCGTKLALVLFCVLCGWGRGRIGEVLVDPALYCRDVRLRRTTLFEICGDVFYHTVHVFGTRRFLAICEFAAKPVRDGIFPSHVW